MKTYLITGGTGLIGSALCKKLSNETVYVLSRQSTQAVQQHCGDNVIAIHSLNEIPEQQPLDIVVNLAGEPIAGKLWTATRKEQLEQSRIELTQILVKWLASRSVKPSKLISGSAIGWYGDMGATTLAEDGSFHDQYTHRLCDRWERQALEANKYDIDVCILRTGLVLSNKGGVLSQMTLPFKLGFGGKISDGRQYMSWIHIDDMINLIQHIATNDNASGIYNATAPEPVTNKTFSKLLAASLNRPCLLTTPAWLLKLILGELAQLVINGQRVIPQKAQAEGFKFDYTTLQQALTQLLAKD
jgi:hypothetical protein